MIIYLESTLKLIEREVVERLIQQGEIKEVNGVKYLKL